MRNLLLLVLASFFVCLFSACSKAKRAADDFCKCDEMENLIDKAVCKKDVLYEHREDLKNEEFRTEFWEQVRKNSEE